VKPLSPVPRSEAAGLATVSLEVHIQPNARRTQIVGRHGERLKIKVAAPPIDGKANLELCRFLAKAFAIPKSHVAIASGQHSRQKRIALRGVTKAALERVADQPGNQADKHER